MQRRHESPLSSTTTPVTEKGGKVHDQSWAVGPRSLGHGLTARGETMARDPSTRDVIVTCHPVAARRAQPSEASGGGCLSR